MTTNRLPLFSSGLLVDVTGRVGSPIELLALLENAPGIIRTAHAEAPGLKFDIVARGKTLCHFSAQAVRRLVLDTSGQAPALQASIHLKGKAAWELLLHIAREGRLPSLRIHLRGFDHDAPFNENCELSLTLATLDLARHKDEGTRMGGR